MHDLRFIRECPDLFDKALEKRGKKPKSQRILVLDIEYRQALTKVQELQNERNQLAKKFAEAKRTNGATEELSKKAEKVKAEIAVLEETTHSIKQKLDRILSEIPNMIAEDVPEGKSADDNVVIRVVKEPNLFSFPPKQHFELGEQLSQMDFERASKLSGARFVVLKGRLAQLERALAHFMLDIHIKEF
ncbi:MAG: serine--tRNA ligase, partial [Proteobacteria bacterium]|nr:serine--tRNA ligase [Pseudomonadota bacterium]